MLYNINKERKGREGERRKVMGEGEWEGRKMEENDIFFKIICIYQKLFVLL